VGKGQKRLDAMRRNAKDDWTIEDIESVCREYAEFGLTLEPPSHGSHYKVSHPECEEILTIPARKLIKPIYVKRFVSMIDSITGEAAEGE